MRVKAQLKAQSGQVLLVPNYVGMTYEEAVKSVDSNSSITIYRTFNDEYSDDYAEGKIMSQTPAAGSKITQEDSVVVSVCVSKGSQMRTLPKVEGENLIPLHPTLPLRDFLRQQNMSTVTRLLREG